MPPRWPRQPDRSDPAYRRLEDRMNFAVHVAVFAASNSGLWFFHIFLRHQGSLPQWVTGVWGAVLALHFLYITAIAKYDLNTDG